MAVDLSLSEVQVSFGTRGPRLYVPKLKVPGGSQLLIQGPSGRGKTTLLHLLAGLLKPDSGRIDVGGINLVTASEAERRRLRREAFGIVFQTLNLLDHLTPLENIELVVGTAVGARMRAMAALADVGLESEAGASTAVLSVGQRQRVAIARVLAARPSVILADEPTSSLDAANARLCADALFAAAKNATLVVVSHDLRLAERFHTSLTTAEIFAP